MMDSFELPGDCLGLICQAVKDESIKNALFLTRAPNRLAEMFGHGRAPILGQSRFKDCFEHDPDGV